MILVAFGEQSGGRRVFIKDGQDLSSAMKESGKFKNLSLKKPKPDKHKDEFTNLEEVADKFNINSDIDLEIRAKELFEKIGYGDKPQIVSKEEFEKATKESKFGKLERGYRAETEEQALNNIEQYKNGELFIGTGRVWGARNILWLW